MKTLLLAGYRPESQTNPGLVNTARGLALDERIDELLRLGADVTCVVSGASAEVLLRESRRLSQVDLVFDTNGEDVSVVSNLRAGLAALNGEPCFALPVELACPPRPTWTALWNAGLTVGPNVSFVRAEILSFPLLLTRFGIKELGRLADVKTLADTRLEPFAASI